jgi:flagellar biosynthesis activator protein FlaF
MQNVAQAARAYETGASHRSMREQQADVFRWANSFLRQGRDSDALGRVRALANNRRLWGTVINLMQDPANPLPAPLRGSIISLGMAVQRNMDRDQPDFDFLIQTNENMAAGLSGQP